MPVSVQQLTKTYGEQRAIDNLSFEVKPGEILGFLGPNGAGKTTTMKIITCFMPPSSGTVTLDAYNIFDHPLEIRRLVGYLPEHNPLYLDLYVQEFLSFAGRLQGLKGKALKQRVTEVIAMTGLGREQHKKLGMLSKGFRQRAGLSQALIHDPEVLILDEPTSGLDPNQIVDIRSLIREIGQTKTVIFSSHILSEVEAIADRVLIINRGRIVADEVTANLRNRLTDEAVVHIELAAPGFDLTALQGMEGVKQIDALDDTHFRLHTQLELDVRPRIFEECVRQQVVLLGMQQETFTLEDAFRRLTAGEKSADPSPASS